MVNTLSRRQRSLIRSLFLSDQRQRFIQSKKLEKDDSFRYALVSTMARSQRQIFAPSDAYRLGMILHHAGDAHRAKHVLRTSLGRHPKGIWLMCAVIDRQLLERGLPQRSGTQFRVDPVTREWRLIEPE